MKVLVLFDLPRAVAADKAFTLKELRENEDRPTEADVISSLRKIGHEVDTLAIFDNVGAVIEKIQQTRPDVVFNLCESFFNERSREPNIPALLDLLKQPYTGAGPESLMLCKDKSLAKTVLSYHRIRVPRFVISLKRRPLRTLRRFSFPAFIKPMGEESSDGIAKASFGKNAEEAIERARFIHQKFGCDAMIEEYIEGRELYVSVLGNTKVTIFPPTELFFGDLPEGEPKFATFRTKWDDEYRKRWNIRNGPAASFSDGMDKKLAQVTRRVYSLLKIRGFGRVDFRLTPNGDLVFLEANPNPSLAKEDDFARSAAAGGVDYEDLMRRILDTAKSA